MTDEPDRDRAGESPQSLTDQEDELAHLRQLLFSTERSQINNIFQRLDDPHERAREIAKILPEAFFRRTGKDEELVKALMPTVEEILRVSVRRNPRPLVDSLFPLMGPAIRRALSEAIRGMVQSLNETLDKSLSIQGLKWRLEALRTGKPFAEIVLLNSLLYRVEQVFLIHKETGLLLGHVTAEAVDHEDADLVSGMLTAIQDFIRDSFRSDGADSLENLRVGELSVLIEQGPRAYIAAVIRGNVPSEVHLHLAEALELVHLMMGEALETFEGDAAPFQAVKDVLQDCLQYRLKEKEKKGFPYFRILMIAAIAGLICFIFLEARHALRWNGYVEQLDREKGLVVVASERSGGNYTLAGLRDPLADDPSGFLNAYGLDPRDVTATWKPFVALDPQFILQRARDGLKPPETASFFFDNGVLSAKGSASYQWILDSRKLAPVLPGIVKYDDTGLKADYELMLDRIAKALQPPSTARLEFSDGVLTASGQASYEWIKTTQRLVGLLRGVKSYRDSTLKVDYTEFLRQVRKALAPPAGVSLKFDNGTLTATGRAPYDWIKESRKLVRVFPEVTKYEEKGLEVNYDGLLARYRKVLVPPQTVSLTIKDGILLAAGSASHEWIASARNMARHFQDVDAYQDDAVNDLDLARLRRLNAQVRGASLRFEDNTETLSPGQNKVLADLVKNLRLVRSTAEILKIRILLQIQGHTDSKGTERHNRELSKRRADKIASYLVSKGFPRSDIAAIGVGASQPTAKETSEESRSLNRRVSFALKLDGVSAERNRR
jgi:outer membrane protein OmpA-like peptidoglycan-associated protein